MANEATNFSDAPCGQCSVLPDGSLRSAMPSPGRGINLTALVAAPSVVRRDLDDADDSAFLHTAYRKTSSFDTRNIGGIFVNKVWVDARGYYNEVASLWDPPGVHLRCRPAYACEELSLGYLPQWLCSARLGLTRQAQLSWMICRLMKPRGAVSRCTSQSGSWTSYSALAKAASASASTGVLVSTKTTASNRYPPERSLSALS